MLGFKYLGLNCIHWRAGTYQRCHPVQSYASHRIRSQDKRDNVLGQGTATLFGKPADRENGRLASQRIIFLLFFSC